MATFHSKLELTDGKGHAILYLKKDNNAGTILLQIRDGEEGSTTVVPGIKYWVEWHFWSDQHAAYALSLNGPQCPPFPVNDRLYKYDKPHDDEATFSFTC